MKWVVGVIILIGVVLIAWQSGMLGQLPGSASMATTTDNGSATTVTPVTEKNVSALDVKFTASGAHINALDKDLTAAKVAAVAAELEEIASDMLGFTSALTAHISNTPAAKRPALVALFSDMATQISNAASLITSAADNSKTANAAGLKQAKTQLQTALSYLQAAKTDISKIIRG